MADAGNAPGLDPEAGALYLRLCVLREGDNVEKRCQTTRKVGIQRFGVQGSWLSEGREID